MDFWEWLRGLGGGGGRSWNENLASSYHRSPPLSLTRSIAAVLSRNEYQLAPGAEGTENNPFVLPEIIVEAYQNPVLQAEQHRLETTGITNERLSSQGTGLQRYLAGAAHDLIRPNIYPTRMAEAEEAFQKGEVGEAMRVLLADVGRDPQRWESRGERRRGELMRGDVSSEDAWSLYLGLPQQQGTYEVSPFQPATSKDKNAVYYRRPNLLLNLLGRDGDPVAGIREAVEYLRTNDAWLRNADGVMGDLAHRRVKLGQGADERGPYISLYDIYDLDAPIEGQGAGVGRPFEIYDRLYYDPQTFRPRR